MIKKIFSVVVIALLLLSHISSFLVTDKETSDLELRPLAQKPELQEFSQFNPTTLSEYEKYYLDQFVYRNEFVQLSSRFEKLLHKNLRNNIYISDDNNIMFFKPYEEISEEDTFKYGIKQASFASQLIEKTVEIDAEFFYYDIPYKYDFYHFQMPAYMAQGNFQELLYNEAVVRAFEDRGSNVIRSNKMLEEHKNEYIYFKTDTHMNGYGSLLAYFNMLDSLGIRENEHNVNKYSKITYEAPFVGNYIRQLADFSFQRFDTFDYYLPDKFEKLLDFKFDRYESGEVSERAIISPDENTSTYGNFMTGDRANTIIINNSENNGKKILIIGDSYTNALEFYASFDFKEMHSLDLRHYKGSVSEYLEEHGDIDYVVFLRRTLLSFLED